jgi:hypothetical protein
LRIDFLDSAAINPQSDDLQSIRSPQSPIRSTPFL